MASGEVVIQSMWSRRDGRAHQGHRLRVPAARKRAIAPGPPVLACPATLAGKSSMAPTSSSTGSWTAGPVLHLNRQGYYSAVLDTAKAKMEAYEWAYWMEGKAARQRHQEPQRRRAGQGWQAVRDGGSYESRMGGIACWNAIMDENEHMVRKWNEFVAA